MIYINPYLNLPGTTEEAFNFYKSVFGGEFTILQRFKDTPEASKLSAADQEKIMHVSLPVGSGVILMGTDALESMGQKVTAGDNISISINTDSKEEAKRVFDALSAGGKVEMDLQDTFWNAYFGFFRDKYGIHWMVNYDYPKN